MVNCAPFLPKLVVKEIGIAPSSPVILQPTTKSRSILSKLPLNSFWRESLPSRPFRFFLISFSSSLTTSRGRLLRPPLTPQNSLLPQPRPQGAFPWPGKSALGTRLFVTALDQAFFKTLFYSGDRAGNLGQVKTAEIARFPR